MELPVQVVRSLAELNMPSRSFYSPNFPAYLYDLFIY